MNTAWQAMHLDTGTQVRIHEDALIDAVRLPGREEWISSPYAISYGPVINSKEAQPYLGQSGTVIEQGFGHSPHIRMADGAVVVVMYRRDVTEI